jgi:DMSO reductase family type II enzyme molybdopterin subunit
MMVELTRRKFIKDASIVSLSMMSLSCSDSADISRRAAGTATGGRFFSPSYGDWQDIYREQWQWDKVVKGAHHVLNCVSACPFNVYVKDGIVWREEQNPIMDATSDKYPDFNPRGCQKGNCSSQLMYGPNRLQHPLRRVGERGEGKWKRISWDEALTEIADKMVEIAEEDGPDSIIYDSGTANIGYGSEGSEMVLFGALGATSLDGWGGAGDMPLGIIMTYGQFNVDSSSDDYFNSDLILLWIGNPSATRIPDAHFLWEARYNGTRIISIAPDYNASTMHCDQWLNVKMGSDSALGLAAAQVIIEENLYDKNFVQEQTDLPLLVRTDTKKFLTQADMEADGVSNIYYLWDSVEQEVVEAPGSEGHGRSSSLEMDGMDPALTGTYAVKTANGDTVEVRPVWETVVAHLQNYTPEKAASIVGVGADTIREFGRECAKARAMSIFGSWGIMKHHHSDLYQRAMCLLLALTGNVGKPGAGLRVGAWYVMSGLELSMMQKAAQPSWWQKALLEVYTPTVREVQKFSWEYEEKYMYMWTPQLLFLYQHAGLDEAVNNPAYQDPKPGVPMKEAIKTAWNNDWLPQYPSNGKQPRMFFHTRVNPLRRWPKPQLAREKLFPKFELIVGFNTKMSTTCMYSDIVLPATHFYERRGIKYAQSYLPYYVVGDKAVEPRGDTRTEWEWTGELARMITERAKNKGLNAVIGGKDRPVDLTRVWDIWSSEGKFDPSDDHDYYDSVTRNSPEIGNRSWDEVVEKGAVHIEDIGPYRVHSNICTDYKAGEPTYSSEWFVKDKQPWPTLTGRQQFYLDHDWFLAAEEHIPTHKAMPKIGGDYPLRLSGGHPRWSIHSSYTDHYQMLQLQRGEPVVFLGTDDAAARSLQDNDRVRVFNDEGECELLLSISPSVQPGQCIIYMGWEPFNFKNWRGNQEPVASVWKPLHMLEYGQLKYRFIFGGPHHSPRGTTLEIEKAKV